MAVRRRVLVPALLLTTSAAGLVLGAFLFGVSIRGTGSTPGVQDLRVVAGALSGVLLSAGLGVLGLVVWQWRARE